MHQQTNPLQDKKQKANAKSDDPYEIFDKCPELEAYVVIKDLNDKADQEIVNSHTTDV